MSDDNFGSPHVAIIGGESVSFPRLDMDDLEAWGNELEATRRAKAEKRINETKYPSNLLRLQALQKLDDEIGEFNMLFVLQHVRTPAGIKRVITGSLAKSGKSPDEIKAILGKLPPLRQAEIALEIAGIPKPKPEENAKDDESGNADGAT